MHRAWTKSAFAAAATLCLARAAAAQEPGAERPLWEVGIAAIGGTYPDYPASNQNHLHAIPLPYIVYRGNYFQLGLGSVRGIVLNTPELSIDVSAAGAFPSTHNDEARSGMPGLDYTGEIGPRLNVLLAHDAATAKLDLEFPVRAVFSTNFSSIAYRGFVLAPEAAYTNGDFEGTGGQLKLGIGPLFATTRLMDYFYQVEPQYVISGRPAYEAHGGYLGSDLDVSYRYPLNQRLTITGLFHPQLFSGATNAGSPLFKKSYGASAGLAVSFSFWGSAETTTVPSED